MMEGIKDFYICGAGISNGETRSRIVGQIDAALRHLEEEDGGNGVLEDVILKKILRLHRRAYRRMVGLRPNKSEEGA